MILIATPRGEYELVEGIHAVVLHLFTKYFKDYFGYIQHTHKDVTEEYTLATEVLSAAASESRVA